MRCGGEVIRPVLSEASRTASNSREDEVAKGCGPDMLPGEILKEILKEENYARKKNEKNKFVDAKTMMTKENSMDFQNADDSEKLKAAQNVTDSNGYNPNKMAQDENQGILQSDDVEHRKLDKSNAPSPLYNKPHHETRARYLSQLLETLRRIGKIRITWDETVAAHYAYFNSDLNALEKEAQLLDLASIRAYIADKIAIKTKGGTAPNNRILRLRTNWRAGMTPRREANDFCESSSDDDRSRSVDSRGQKKPKKPRTWQSPVYECKKSRTPSPSRLPNNEVSRHYSPDRPMWRRERSSSPKRDRPLWREDRPLWSAREPRKSRKDTKRRSRRGSNVTSPWRKSSMGSRSSSTASDESVLTDWAPEESRHRNTRSSRGRRVEKKRRNRSRRRSSRSSSRSSSPPRRRNANRRRRNHSSSRDEISRSPKRHRSRSRSRIYSRAAADDTFSSTSTYRNFHRSNSRTPLPKRSTLADKIGRLAVNRERPIF